MAGEEGEGAPFVQAEGKASRRPDAKAEFRRAYLILAVFAILIIAAFMATKSRASGSDLKRFTQGKDTNLEDQNDLENGFSSTSELPDIQGESASAVENLIEAVYDSGQEAEEGDLREEGVVVVEEAEKANVPKPAVSESSKSEDIKRAGKPKVASKAGVDFNQPQHICPGSPTKKGLGTGGPRQNKDIIRQILEHLGDGEVPDTTSDTRKIKSGNFGYKQIECPFLTRDCASLRYSTGKSAAARLKQSGAKWNETAQKLPDLKPGSLGSCALIGNSDNMLKHEWGSQIDAHDTVIRHNTPVGKYAKHVGKKATIVWVKGRYKGGGSASASLAYLLPKNINELPRNLRHKGKPVLIRGIGAKPIDKTKRLLYFLQGANLRRKHPTGGYSRPLNVIASKLCTRVDLYGFGSRNGSGKYFKKSAKVRPAHMMAYEHWTFRYLMSKGKLCVYGE